MIEIDKIYNEDCLQGMKRIPDGSVDLILCDLPYGTTACKWDVVIPFDKLWEQYERVAKPNGAVLLFGSEPFSSYLRMSNIFMYKYDWIWHKSSSGSFANAKNAPMKFHENISVFYKKQPTYNPQFQEYAESVKNRFKSGDRVNRVNALNRNNIQDMMSNVCSEISYERGKYPETVQFFKSVPNCNGKKLHPTQKPVELLEYFVRTYTNEGDLILDNCMGSGTTAVAAVREKRHFVGFELNKEYYEIACNRIKEELQQIKLF